MKKRIAKKEMRGQRFSASAYYTDGSPQPEAFSNIVDTYSEHLWVYACVKAIATNLASLPFCAYNQDKDLNWVENPKHPLIPLLKNPNPYFSMRDLIAFTSISLDLVGNAYWGMEKNGLGKPYEVYPLPAGDVKIVGTKEKLISHYIYTVNNVPIRYELDELIHFREPNPTEQLYGLGSVKPALLAITTDFYAQTYNKMFFKNNARPDAVLETDQNLDETTAKRIIASWKAAQEGSEKRGKTALMSNGVKYREVNRTPKDIDFLEGRKQNREEILAAFGVPPVIVGIFEYANYANSKEQIQIFWKHTLIPRKDLIETAVTRWAQKYSGDKASIIELETAGVDALAVDEAQRAATAKVYVDMGVPINKVIDALELPFEPIDGGDVPRPPAPTYNAPPGGDNKPPVPPAKSKGAPRIYSPGEMAKQALWKSYDDQLSSHESALKTTSRIFFKGQKRRVLKAWEAHAEKILAGKVGKAFKASDASLSVDLIFKEADEQSRLKGPVFRVIKGTYVDFAVSVGRRLDPSFDFDLSDPAAEHFLENKVFKLVRQVNEFTKESITQAIIDGVQEATAEGFSMGESIADIADRIEEVYKFADESRAERIARTETGAAANAGATEGMKQAGAEKKEWLATRDDKTRDSHAALDGEVVGIDDAFVSETGAKLEYPGDPSAPPEEVINCRCTILPVVSED